MPRGVPPLRNGDRLGRAEFERRYAAMPDGVKAELIEGFVYIIPPVSAGCATAHFRIIGWLWLYVAATPGLDGGDNGTLRLDMDNEPQPDAFLRILQAHGGQTRVDKDGYITGAPELVAEVAVSSVSYDLHAKLNVYRRNGVREYVVWRVEDLAIDWFVLRDSSYGGRRSALQAPIRAKSFLVCGWTRRRCCAATCSRSPRSFSRGWQVRITLAL